MVSVPTRLKCTSGMLPNEKKGSPNTTGRVCCKLNGRNNSSIRKRQLVLLITRGGRCILYRPVSALVERCRQPRRVLGIHRNRWVFLVSTMRHLSVKALFSVMYFFSFSTSLLELTSLFCHSSIL